MSEITIRSQEELDALKAFETETKVYVDAKEILIKGNIKNATIVLIGNSSAVLSGNSSAVLSGNSSAVLSGNSSAVLSGNSSAVLSGNSSAVLWNNSSAVLWNNSSAVLWNNSSAVLSGNSSAVLSGNSSAVLWNNSRAELFGNSVAWSYSNGNTLAYQNSVVFTNRGNVKTYDNATIKPLEIPTVSFDEWLKRGWVVADGIYRKLVSQKTIGDISVYETDKGYVVKNGDKFSHGDTIDKAIEDLRYKIGDRDSSKFSAWKLDDVKPIDELIEAYRVITGACEMGVKDFCWRTPLAEKMTVMDAIKITENHYGANQFKSFFMKGSSE